MPAKGKELAPQASLPRRPATYGSMPMNKPISAKDVAAPKVTTGALPGSRKVYSAPKGHADLAVPLREIALTDGATFRVYDTSGPYSDPSVEIDVRRGLPSLRETWIKARGGVQAYYGRAVKA